MATDAQRNSCQVRTLTPEGGDIRWFGALGHVNGETHSFAYPGGCDAFSCTLALQLGATARTDALNPGRILEVWKGCNRIWEGILNEPVPNTSGWSVTANGNGTYGNNLMAFYPIRTDIGCATTKGSTSVLDGAGGTFPLASDVGAPISGNFIQQGTFVTSVAPGTSFTMSTPATGTSNGTTGAAAANITFSGWTLDQVLNLAISRGMRWTKPTFGNQGWMQTIEDAASITITDFLNNATIQAGLLWYVDVHQNNLLQLGPPPTAVNRLLVCEVPNPRTLGAMLNRLWYKYVSSVQGSTQTYAYGSVQNAASISQFGPAEQYVDMTATGGSAASAPVMSSALAASNAQAILNQYITAMYSSTYTVRNGQVLTLGGSPVDLACEPAGNVYRLLLTDGSYGGQVTAGPVTFVGGEVEWDDDSLTAQITPYQSYRSDLSTLLTAKMPQLRM
jgi:hypothetical protein